MVPAFLIYFIVFAPLVGALVAGLFGQIIGRTATHRMTIFGVLVSFLLSVYLAIEVFSPGFSAQTFLFYTWATGEQFFPFSFHIGFLIDSLTALMLLVVTFVSLLVHIYTIGYMADDPGYQRFFSYISLFTFAMLMLVSADNFLQLFFGWEGVGLVSYLLIGFWFKRESANQGSLKAFLVNRVGDFGFILGIALLWATTHSLDYTTVFSAIPALTSKTISLFANSNYSLVTVICLLLFVGAMGKSAQVPLHVWLPESMEGPTPISALIHAATMVTAGVFMVARMSPLYEHSTTALSVVLIIGATGALFTGILALVMNDIKRVVAYSTLSQLGYMMVAMGASAYSAGMFHLTTHACFKALLFLGAGSVIIALHHEQDMRKMGGLWRFMPITYATFLIGTLALCAIPPFSGFFSKDSIIEAVHVSMIPGASYAYYCVLIGAFVTSLYSFRALIMTFHGTPRMDEHTLHHVHESPWVVTLPLILLAIPSVILGFILIKPMLFSGSAGLLQNSITVLPEHNVLGKLAEEYRGIWLMMLEALTHPTFYFAIGGIFTAFLAYWWFPAIPQWFTTRFNLFYKILLNKYGFDRFYDLIFIRGARAIGQFLFGVGDKAIIDGALVNGSGMTVRWLSRRGRVLQSGYLYHYATVMVAGLLILLTWLMW